MDVSDESRCVVGTLLTERGIYVKMISSLRDTAMTTTPHTFFMTRFLLGPVALIFFVWLLAAVPQWNPQMWDAIPPRTFGVLLGVLGGWLLVECCKISWGEYKRLLSQERTQ